MAIQINRSENEVHADAGIFVIPNQAGYIREFLNKTYAATMLEVSQKLCELNGAGGFDAEKDQLIEFWWHGDADLNCDNLSDHIFSFEDETGKTWYGQLAGRHAPAKLFMRHTEGETIQFKYPVRLYGDLHQRCERVPDAEREVWDVVMVFNLNLNQNDYRYSHRAPFENAVRFVIQ